MHSPFSCRLHLSSPPSLGATPRLPLLLSLPVDTSPSRFSLFFFSHFASAVPPPALPFALAAFFSSLRALLLSRSPPRDSSLHFHLRASPCPSIAKQLAGFADARFIRHLSFSYHLSLTRSLSLSPLPAESPPRSFSGRLAPAPFPPSARTLLSPLLSLSCVHSSSCQINVATNTFHTTTSPVSVAITLSCDEVESSMRAAQAADRSIISRCADASSQF